MVEPSCQSTTLRSIALALGVATLLAGCSSVPKSRLEECHRLSQTLEADKLRLKDKVLSLQSQYDDLAQRADDDARRLRVQKEENRRLLGSVQNYQADIAEMTRELGNLKDQIQLAVNPVSTSLLDELDRFTKDRPGCRFDPVEGVLTLSSDTLFEPGSDQLKPDARALLVALAGVLDTPEARGVRMLVAGHTDASPVQRTALVTDARRPRKPHLSLDRATRVRDVLAFEAKLDPATFEVAGFESSRPKVTGDDDASRGENRRIEIRLLGTTGSRGASPAPAADP